MPQSTPKSTLDVLINQGVIDLAKANQAKQESVYRHISPEQILIDKGWATPVDIAKAQSVLYGIPYINITDLIISNELTNLYSESEALQAKILLFEKNEDVYKAAMVNPLDIQTIRLFERKINGRLQVYITTESDLINKIKAVFSSNIGNQITNVVEKAISESEYIDLTSVKSEKLENIENIDINNTPIAKVINIILDTAIQEKASDIHIEPFEKRMRVRFRIHGILTEKLRLPIQIGPSLVSRIKILGKMPIDEKRKPLDGRFQVKSGDQEIDLRISSLPTVLGEKMVIRLLRKDLGIHSLEDTGMRGQALKTFKEGLKSTSGIILVTGPTGSGKTVTMATAMSLLNKPEVNIVSVEDPVEIRIPGVNQVQVNVEAGLTFANALRSFLRQDPDIISVGEIRDAETAELAAQASLTGHLVISTLHTNSAAGALPRLLDMGIEPYIIASSVHICAAQRLCRRICPHCKEVYNPSEAELMELRRVLSETKEFNEQKAIEFQQKYILKNENVSPAAQLVLFRGKGCPKCNNTGYSGRVGIFEVLKVTEKISALVMQHASSDVIERAATEDGMIKMIQDGYFKCIEGITTIEEVQRVIHS
ncbi:MAG: type IV-A pilus assembly ATPase PilB [Candidatus Dojkabacteria bacterium]|nr:MAG: type IV-A pilus assembly ATPase PilB [Candidatus Dojkabacteria bacterium]